MKWLNNKQTGNEAKPYATSEDFRNVFTEDRDDLCQLSLLLTGGDPEKAERCFVAGLEDSIQATQVFKQWALSWAKRTIIQNAIRILQPHPDRTGPAFAATAQTHSDKGPKLQDRHFPVGRVLVLDDFERFVFVMSVLEGYSDRHCSLLLGCSMQEIRTVRAWALARLLEPSNTAAACEIREILETKRYPEVLSTL